MTEFVACGGADAANALTSLADGCGGDATGAPVRAAGSLGGDTDGISAAFLAQAKTAETRTTAVTRAHMRTRMAHLQ
jgi:hypothetical protein